MKLEKEWSFPNMSRRGQGLVPSLRSHSLPERKGELEGNTRPEIEMFLRSNAFHPRPLPPLSKKRGPV